MAVWALCLLFLALTSSLSIISADELALVVGQSVTLHTLPSFLVKKSPGSKPGSVVFAERVKIYGLPRINNLKRFSHSVKVKVSHLNSSLLQPNVEVCFHRNLSLGVGMCPQGQWEKLSNGLWVRTMSPFDNKLLDIRMIGSSSDVLAVAIEEDFLVYRVAFLVLGMVLLVLASTLGKSLVFYYSSAMAVGIILVILMVLFQGMKLLPTGRKTSLAIFMYSSLVGVGSFLLSYSSKLLLAMLSEMGISEDVYNPLAIFLLLFVALAGAWLGFWAVRKLILTEDGSVDASVSLFVAWSIRTIAAVMILQCSLDPLLAATALIFAILVSSMLRRATRLRLLRRLYRKFLKAAKSSPLKSRNNDPNGAYTVYPNNFHWSKDTILRPHSRQPSLALRNSLSRGPATTPPWQMSDSETFYSTFYETPERRKFTKDEWEKFTKGCTKKALEELVSSPDFNKWAVANAERITLTSTKKDDSITSWRPQRWFFWVQ
ncbi:hypothetical protein Nepgr_016693 [Nepenthes gracilis]|uniref:Nuclear envelope integral membrane protein 1 n=1 Tax=Nepenthes gracilis TaxID=150966 RepID=A0AAD3SQX0_NEPGR|nr:hypothetical protein Nepgr_016693 [Nepenthes gracilis]